MDNETNVAITPDSDIYLLKVPFEMDTENVLTFSNATAQENYFMGLNNKLELENATYQRKDGVLRWAGSFDDIIGYNYCMYKNTHFSSKWFFAFIEDIKFENPSMTSIKLKTDVFQTWQFDIVYNKMFVEREHVNDDSIGKHTIPENLELGEAIVQKVSTMNYGSYYTCIAVSEDILRADETTYHHNYNGVTSGLTYIVLQNSIDVNYFIFRYNQSAKIDAISSLFMIPDDYVPAGAWSTDTTGLIHYKYVSEISTSYSIGNLEVLKPSKLGEGTTGYTPINNKLFTFPYCYILADNNAGGNAIYRYEDFTAPTGTTANTVRFKCIGTINPGCSIKYVPVNYKNISDNYNESLNGAKLPLGGWINDVYTNWLRENGLNIGISLGGSILQIVGGIGLTGTGAGGVAGAGQIASGINSIASTIGQVYQHSLIPNQAEGNINSSDIMYAEGKSGLSLYQMSLKIEYLKIIDLFFTMYGYKVNTLKIPNITGRANWNYVKTINCNIVGDFPQKDLLELKGIFDKGVTLWHNPSTFLDYSQSNAIVS